MSKGQSATEFVVITGFMVFVFIMFFIVAEQKLIESNRIRNEKTAKFIMETIISEVKMAESVSDNYYRIFLLPENLNGLKYTVSIIPGVAGTVEVVLNYNEKEIVYFLDDYVDTNSEMSVGRNNITKSNELILISKMN